MLTWSIAPGYQHTFNAHTLLTINPYIRKDQFNYYASRDPFADTPATQSQTRQLLNWGVKSDLAITSGRHNLKIGIDLKQTRLLGEFRLRHHRSDLQSGLPGCRTATPPVPPTLTDPARAARKAGLTANPRLSRRACFPSI